MEATIEPQMGLTFGQVCTIQGIAEQHKETERTVRETWYYTRNRRTA
jgi:hypothetical protein